MNAAEVRPDLVLWSILLAVFMSLVLGLVFAFKWDPGERPQSPLRRAMIWWGHDPESRQRRFWFPLLMLGVVGGGLAVPVLVIGMWQEDRKSARMLERRDSMVSNLLKETNHCLEGQTVDDPSIFNAKTYIPFIETVRRHPDDDVFSAHPDKIKTVVLIGRREIETAGVYEDGVRASRIKIHGCVTDIKGERMYRFTITKEPHEVVQVPSSEYGKGPGRIPSRDDIAVEHYMRKVLSGVTTHKESHSSLDRWNP